MPRILLVAAALAVASTSARPATDGGAFSDGAIKRAMPPRPAPDRANDQSAKDEKKPALVMKALERIQRRACRTTARSTPSTSWPARGQSAISICS
jgi:hypothetical protein